MRTVEGGLPTLAFQDLFDNFEVSFAEGNSLQGDLHQLGHPCLLEGGQEVQNLHLGKVVVIEEEGPEPGEGDPDQLDEAVFLESTGGEVKCEQL